jgi:acyl-CoA hydrolase
MHDEEDRRAILVSEVMTPDKANFSGNVHGGYIMEKCDRVAYACAARYSGHYAVTLSVDHILFKKPIHVGELVSFYATINHVGKTSMEVGIKVVAENLLTQEKRHTNSCFFTMVAVDENMKPTAVPSLELRNETEKRRFEEAILRKEINQSFTQEHERRKKALRSRFSKK